MKLILMGMLVCSCLCSCKSTAYAQVSSAGESTYGNDNGDLSEPVLAAHLGWLRFPSKVEAKVSVEIQDEAFLGNHYREKFLKVKLSGDFPERILENKILVNYSFADSNTILIGVVGLKDGPGEQRQMTSFASDDLVIGTEQLKVIEGQPLTFKTYNVYVTISKSSGQPLIEFDRQLVGTF